MRELISTKIIENQVTVNKHVKFKKINNMMNFISLITRLLEQSDKQRNRELLISLSNFEKHINKRYGDQLKNGQYKTTRTETFSNYASFFIEQYLDILNTQIQINKETNFLLVIDSLEYRQQFLRELQHFILCYLTASYSEELDSIKENFLIYMFSLHTKNKKGE